MTADGKMRADGSWYPEQNGHATIYLGAQPLTPRKNFEFQTDGFSVRSIRYENGWTDMLMLCPVTAECKAAALTVMMSQQGIGLSECINFAKSLDSADMLNDGGMVFDNIKITWDIETENCRMINGQYFTRDDDEKESIVSVVFEIYVQNP